MWDTETGNVTHTFLGHEGKVNCLAISPNGGEIVSGGEDKTVKLWRVGTEACFKTLEAHKEEVTCVAISPDGTCIASGSLDCSILTYSVTSI